MRTFKPTQADKSGYARRFSGMVALAFLLVLAFLLFSPGLAAADDPNNPDSGTWISLDYERVVGADSRRDKDWFRYSSSVDEDVRFEWHNTNKTAELRVFYYTYSDSWFFKWYEVKTPNYLINPTTLLR